MPSKRHRWFAFALSTFACACPSPAARDTTRAPAPAAERPDGAPPLLDRDVFFADGRAEFVSVSRDGTRLLYSAEGEDGARDLKLAPFSAGLAGGRRLIDAARVSQVSWSRDHRWLVLAADDGGDEDDSLLALDLTDPTATLRDLTPHAQPGTSAEICALPVDDPGRIVALINDRDPELPDVYDVDLATGARKVVFRAPPGTNAVYCDRAGRPRLLVRMRPDGSSEFARIDGRKTITLQVVDASEETEVLAFMDEHSVLARTNRGPDRDLSELVTIDLSTGAETLVHRDPLGEVDLDGVELDPVSRRPLAAIYIGDRSRVYPLDDAFGRAWEAAREQHPEADMWLAHTSDDLKVWVLGFDSPTRPPSYWEYRPHSGVMRELTTSLPEMDPDVLAPTVPIRWAARDGLEITGYLTVPRGVPQHDLPLLVMVHGGPWARDVWGWNPEVQFLANRGYAVFQPNFRGSMGFGKAFLRAANRTWGTGAAQHDITDGVAELVRRGVVDRERVCIYGASYGGYAALSGLAFTPALYRCGISYVGPSNLVTLIDSFPAKWRTSLGLWFEAFGDPTVPADRSELEARSPLFAADAIEAPLLLVHGANDPRVKQPESDRIAAALRARAREVRYLVARDEGHGFAQPINQRALYAAMEEFLADHLGGRVQRDVPDEVRARLRELEAAAGG